jgi:hypothetical protein
MAKEVRNTWDPDYHTRYQEEWFRALPAETRQRYYEQDQERLDVWRKLTSGELPLDAWLECCRRQVAENLTPRPAGQTPPTAPDAIPTPLTAEQRSAIIARMDAGQATREDWVAYQFDLGLRAAEQDPKP